MRYVAAYLLAALGGNASPSEKDLKKILSSVGVEVDASSLKLVISELKGKSIEDVLAEGREKLASVPSGAAPAAATASSGILYYFELWWILLCTHIYYDDYRFSV